MTAETFAIGACCFSLGFSIQFYLERWKDRLRESARCDEASRFEPGEVVSFGDGSYIVVDSVPGPTRRQSDHEGE